MPVAVSPFRSVAPGPPPIPSSFPNIPEGWVLAEDGSANPAEWDNEAALTGNGWTITGNPDTGESSRVTTGYGDAPPQGGPAVHQAFYTQGNAGGSGAGRLGFDFDSPKTALFWGIVCKFDADYPYSEVFGGNKMFFTSGIGTGRAYLVFSENTEHPGEDGYWVIALEDFGPTEGIITTAEVVYGEWITLEVLLDSRLGDGAGIFRMWVNGVEVGYDRSNTNLTFPGTMPNFYAEGTNNGRGGTVQPNSGAWYGAKYACYVPGA